VAWAELRLDRGDAATARTTLEAVLTRSPRDARAGLLLDEAEAALGDASTSTLRATCAPDRWLPPAIAAGCALARAARARRSGARSEARAEAERAARAAPDEPRLLARSALLLAQLGAVDRADDLTARAGRLAGPELPALAWARAAGAFGRGRAGPLPRGPRPADPETRLLVARAALAGGGLGGLGSALETLGTSGRVRDDDLRSLARLRGSSTGCAPSFPGTSPGPPNASSRRSPATATPAVPPGNTWARAGRSSSGPTRVRSRRCAPRTAAA
jgi:hypothetical protein